MKMVKGNISRRRSVKVGLAAVAGLLIDPSRLLGQYTDSLASHDAAFRSFAAASVSPVVQPAAGVILGVQSYSFRDQSLDDMLIAMNKLGLSSCELFELHVAPADVFPVRERLMQWRNSVPSSHFEMVREKFSKHKINIQSYAANFKDNVTDEELDSIFNNTRVLGTDILTTSATVSLMKRVDVFAKKYQVRVGMHNHDHTERPNEFSTPETFARGMSGNSNYIMINLDIGHATSANYDPLAYLKTIHDKVVCIHVKDRKRDHGPRTRFGEGDTPIAEVLRAIRDNGWNIPANIEFEYRGDTMEEMKRCVEYCRNVLENK